MDGTNQKLVLSESHSLLKLKYLLLFFRLIV